LSGAEYENAEVQDEFYDAIAAESSTSDDESDGDEGLENKVYLNLSATTKFSIEIDVVCVLLV